MLTIQVVERLRNSGIIKDDTPQVNALLKKEVNVTCILTYINIYIHTYIYVVSESKTIPLK